MKKLSWLRCRLLSHLDCCLHCRARTTASAAPAAQPSKISAARGGDSLARASGRVRRFPGRCSSLLKLMCVASSAASCGITVSLKSSGNHGMPGSRRREFTARMPIAAAVLRHDAGAQILPQQRQMFTRRDDFRARQTKVRVPNQMAAPRRQPALPRQPARKIPPATSRTLRQSLFPRAALRWPSFEFLGHVAQSDVVHDDEFVQRRDSPFADRSVREYQQLILQCVNFQLGQNVPLRIQQQRPACRALRPGISHRSKRSRSDTARGLAQ